MHYSGAARSVKARYGGDDGDDDDEYEAEADSTSAGALYCT